MFVFLEKKHSNYVRTNHYHQSQLVVKTMTIGTFIIKITFRRRGWINGQLTKGMGCGTADEEKKWDEGGDPESPNEKRGAREGTL
jgi:hypothetical protein